jgi:hypothetical protein
MEILFLIVSRTSSKFLMHTFMKQKQMFDKSGENPSVQDLKSYKALASP